MLMTNYLKMPKKSHVLALLELSPHRSGDRRPSRNGLRVRPDAPGKCGKNVPRLRPLATNRFRRSDGGGPFKCGQNVRRLERKTGQNVPRLWAARAIRRRRLSRRDS